MTKEITICGAGALGSHLVLLLRNEDIKITVVDFDKVEQKNCASQFHGTKSVRKFKSTALKQSMQFLFGTKIEANTNKIVEENADRLIGGDLIVDCLDNGASRRLVQRVAKEKGIPCLHGGLAANGEFGRAIWSDDFVVDDEGAPGEATCENGEELPFICLTAAYMSRSVQDFLSSGKRIGYSVSRAGAFVI